MVLVEECGHIEFIEVGTKFGQNVDFQEFTKHFPSIYNNIAIV